MFRDWIAARAAGLSFIDIGGIGENALNETVSTALAHGAARASIADIQDFSAPMWGDFHARMAGMGIEPARYTAYDRIDVAGGDLTTRLPVHDMVHSTGILYHLSDPARALWNLRRVTGRYLVTNTVIMPDSIENEHGRLDFRGSTALFLPGIDATERAILRQYYRDKFGWDLNQNAPPPEDTGAGMPHLTETGPSPWPYWFLFTAAGFRGLVRMAGFRIQEEWVWENHAHFVLAERV